MRGGRGEGVRGEMRGRGEGGLVGWGGMRFHLPSVSLG